MSPEAWIQLAGTLVVVLGILWRLATMTTKFETIGQQQADEIRELKNGVKRIADVVTDMAVQTARMNAMTDRLTRMENMVDEIRHGEGFIMPLVRPKPPG